MRLHRRAYLARGLSVAAVAAVLALAATEERRGAAPRRFRFQRRPHEHGCAAPDDDAPDHHAAHDRRQDGQSQIRFEMGLQGGLEVGGHQSRRRPQAAERPRGRRKVSGARRRTSAALAWPLSASRLGSAGCDRHRRCDRNGRRRCSRRPACLRCRPPADRPVRIRAARSARINIPPQNENRFVPNEVVLEFAGNLPPQAIVALAQRHRLARLELGEPAEHRHDVLPRPHRRRPAGARGAGRASA